MAQQRWKLTIEYRGTDFAGWQRQEDGVPSVQQHIEDAIARFCGQECRLHVAGRTDAGVHATGQVVHFDTNANRPLTAWVRGVNTFLPPAVAVRWAHPVADEFHARFSAYARRYRYLLLNRPQRPGVQSGRVGWCHQPLDVVRMQAAAEALLGEHDFSSFRAAECQAKSPQKTMHVAQVRRVGEVIVFDFEASAFLHHMVRNLVGSLVYIGQGRQPADWMQTLLEVRDRRVAAPTFAAEGLYLVGVRYEAHWGLPNRIDDGLSDLQLI